MLTGTKKKKSSGIPEEFAISKVPKGFGRWGKVEERSKI